MEDTAILQTAVVAIQVTLEVVVTQQQVERDVGALLVHLLMPTHLLCGTATVKHDNKVTDVILAELGKTA